MSECMLGSLLSIVLPLLGKGLRNSPDFLVVNVNRKGFTGIIADWDTLPLSALRPFKLNARKGNTNHQKPHAPKLLNPRFLDP